MPEWLTTLFTKRRAISSGFGRVVSLWKAPKQVEELLARVALLEMKNPPGQAHFKGARWAYVELEASNVPFCETCFQERQSEMHRMNEGVVENGKQSLWCSRSNRHRVNIEVESYLWAKDKANLRKQET